MEQNKNNRLDDLFNQAKNEPAKIPFEETKAQFIQATSVAGNVAKAGKLTQFTNFKLILMITTITAITVGTTLFFSDFSEPTIQENKTVKNSETTLSDSALIIEEHEKVVNEYFEKVTALSIQLLLTDTNKRKLSKRKHKVIDRTWFLEEQDTAVTNIVETVENYRFPNLNNEDWKEHQKQMRKMFGKTKKSKRSIVGKKNREQWYQPDPYGFLFIPMGSYQRKGKEIKTQAFYMKQTEVTNLEYRTFLFDLLRQGRKAGFLVAKPDQTRWVKDYPNAFNKPMQENYFSHPAYDDYPVVGISRIGAEMYCKWMTDELNKVAGEGMVNDFRLPTKFEWEYAAKGGLKEGVYPWGGPYVRNSKGCFLANFRPMKDNYTADGAFHTAKANSYNPNEYGLYCMSGNVAEMIIDENNEPATKGGSWTSIGHELQIIDGPDRFKGFTQPSVDVGFRPVMTYLGRAKGMTKTERKTELPPGTVKVDGTTYMDETEVSNFMWMEYVYWNGRSYGFDSPEYIKTLPDTTVWEIKQEYNAPYVKLYLRHPAYRDYPIVGITYEQALDYCKWRTNRVKESFEKRKGKDKKSIFPTEFKCRLPTKKEWESVAKIGYSDKVFKKIEGKYEGKHRTNFFRNESIKESIENNGADVTAPIFSYWPNKLGVYNLKGNVAEMTLEKGIAKGGSWVHTKEETTIEKDFKYTSPQSWLGFRCVFVENK
ncbi:MAG: SUMF1/EgtB/PvdO family nonheme iron enzyme [Vicingaceae bacterium]